MKKFFGLLLLLALIFSGAYYAGKSRQRSLNSENLSQNFKPSPYPLLNRSFVIIIVGFNNGAWLEKTLTSVFRQNYSNFRIVYIDDASNDGSFDLAQDLIEQSSQTDRIMLLHNEVYLGPTQNYARAVSGCNSEEIVVILNGEDWLAHEWVLSRLNQYYANPNLWMTYGGAIEYPSYAMMGSKIADPKIPVRLQPFFASHLQSFYADLFQKIAPEDLLYPAASQQAYMFPLLEMAQGHIAMIPDVLYIANKQGLKENPEISMQCEKAIRMLGAYSSLVKRSIEPVENEAEEQ